MTDQTLSEPASQPAAPAPDTGMDRRLERPRLAIRRRTWIIGGGIALGVSLAALAWLVPPPGSLTVKTANLEIGQVQRAPFQDYLPVRAAVAPLHTMFVTAVAGGQVDKILVLDGSPVSSGTALATLNNPQLKLDVTSREAEIAGRLSDSSAQLLSLQRNRLDREKEVSETSYGLLKAQHDLDVRQRLHDKGIVSDAELKTFASETAYFRARLAALKTGQRQEDSIAASQADQIRQTGQRLNSNLGVVQSSLDALVVRAPVDGRLTDFTLQPGQTLKAGDPVGQVDSEGAYKLTADVDEFYLGRVAVGQRATADLDGKVAGLSVSRVLPQVANGRFRIELTFDKPPAAPLRRGESVDVRVILGDTRPALVLPNGAWLEAGGGAYAFVLRSSGRQADRRPIAIGRRNPEQVEVASGLRPGERVVTSSYAGFEKSTHLILN
jgi:HlyD family secretion protein